MPATNIRKRALTLLLTLVIAYTLALLILRAFESRFIFFPNYPDRLAGDWHPRNLPVQDVWLTLSDGIKLHTWWIPNSDARFTFLAFHGNAGNITSRIPVYAFLRNTPGNVLAVEYSGYGRSEGSPGEAAMYRDASAAYQYLVRVRGIGPKSIIVFGQSLGTAVAAHLTAQHQVGGVILEAPFPSASRLAQRVFWFLPGLGLMVHGQFDTLDRVNQINAPILIVQCSQDPVIPSELGQEVYQASPAPKTLLTINGFCHEEASLLAPVRYQLALQGFLSAIAPATTQPTSTQ